MNSKDEIKNAAKPTAASSAMISTNETGVLDGVIQAGGYDSGRLFYSTDKATYTFLDDNDVVSLHFDMVKQELYFKGHKVTCLDAAPPLADYLMRFKKALCGQKSARKFLAPFDAAVSRVSCL